MLGWKRCCRILIISGVTEVQVQFKASYWVSIIRLSLAINKIVVNRDNLLNKILVKNFMQF